MSVNTNPKQRTLVIGLIILGILFTAFFGLRAFHAFKRFNGHPPPPSGKMETDVELIRDWMTIPFISRMYRVPTEVLFEALKVSPQKDREKSLKEINEEYFPEADGIAIELVKAVILVHQPPLTPVPLVTP